MDFQNSCVVPFGMTAIVKVLPSDFFPQPASAMSAIVAASERRDFMAGGYCKGPAFLIPGPLRFLPRVVCAGFLQIGVDGLSETRFCKTDDLRAFDAKMRFQIGFRVMLDDRIMLEFLQDLRPAVFGNVC